MFLDSTKPGQAHGAPAAAVRTAPGQNLAHLRAGATLAWLTAPVGPTQERGLSAGRDQRDRHRQAGRRQKSGHPVLWASTASLVQRLLAAKRDLRLPQELTKLDKFACVILDDIGYVQHDRDEMEVLFTFLAERYERKSVMITTNLVFSEWQRIFKDPMTTLHNCGD
jgi:hypothetical protein